MKMKIRDMQEDDKAFIHSSWKRYMTSMDHYTYMDKETYYAEMEDLIEIMINTHEVKIICPEEADFQIFGYLVYDNKKNMIIFAYVKSIYRENGLFKKMVAECFDDFPQYYCQRTKNKQAKQFNHKYKLEYMPIEFVK